MNTRRSTPIRGASRRVFSLAVVCLMVALPTLEAQGKKKNPVSKLYVSDVSGEAEIDTGESIEDLSKRSVYTAQGTTIETKKPERESDRDKYYSTMVYSNGTGAFFDADTRVEVKRFVQEPFLPNRTDVEVEPSISQTHAFIPRGTVGLCTSKLVAGSVMAYQTPHGTVNIRGQKVVIEANGDYTKISMLDGESTVRAGSSDMGGHIVRAGEQAIIQRGANGEPNRIQIAKIPQNEAAPLDNKVTMACMAKKTVYFEVRDREVTGEGPEAGGSDVVGENASGPVSAFDTDPSVNGRRGRLISELVPIEVVPSNLPVQFTISPSTIITPAGIVTPGRGTPGG